MGEKPQKSSAGPWKRVMTLQIFAHFGLKRHAEKVQRSTRRVRGPFRGANREKKEHVMRLSVSLMLAVGIMLGSIATVTASSFRATVTVDGSPAQTVSIDTTDPKEILANQIGVSVKADDLLQSSQAKSGNLSITLKTAKRVSVSADGKTAAEVMHYGDTVAGALAAAGVAVGPLDAVSPAETAKVSDGMKVTVTRRYHVTVAADGKTVNEVVPEGTVSQALAQAGVVLGAEDTTSVSPSSPVAEGMDLQVGRVAYRDVTSTQAVAYATVTQKDSSLSSGTKKVKTQGRNGVKTTVTRQKLLNGNVVQNTVVKAEVTKQPVSEVVSVGTKSSGSSRSYSSGRASVGSNGTLVDQNGDTVSYRKVLTGQCTAYSCGTTTSTGRSVRYGLVAVNPNIIPYGTKLYICSPDGRTVYGYATAADTGGAAMSGRILADLYYPSESQCYSFGRRTMNVYVLG